MSVNLSSVLTVSMGNLISRVHLFISYGTIWYLYPGNWARAGHTMAIRSIKVNIFFIGESLCNAKQARCRMGRTCLNLSGRRVSNPRPSAWEANALPTELLSRLRCKSNKKYNWGLSPIVLFLGGLMLRAEQVVDRLDGIEGAERNLYEQSVPVTHGTVPQAGQFQSLEFTSVLGLA